MDVRQNSGTLASVWLIVVIALFGMTRTQAASAVISVSNGELTAPAAVAFDGSASGSDANEWAWDFGDGSTGTGSTTTHTYAAAGTYTATLKVRDSAGGNSGASAKVVVNDAAAPLPVTSFTGKFGKPGKTSARLSLNLPDGTSLGSTVTLVIGTLKVTYSIVGTSKGLAKKGSSMSVSGTLMNFKIVGGSVKSIFGSVPTSGSKTVAITVNGIAYTSTVTFSAMGAVVSFH